MCHQTICQAQIQRQAPDWAGAKRLPGAGRRLPAAFGPPDSNWIRHRMAEATASANHPALTIGLDKFRLVHVTQKIGNRYSAKKRHAITNKYSVLHE
jgi:hypothetical protein